MSRRARSAAGRARLGTDYSGLGLAGGKSLFIVHTESSQGWGGQEIRILSEAHGMTLRGHRVEIWGTEGSRIQREAQARGIASKGLPIGAKRLRGVLAMRRALLESRPDIVNTHSSTDAWLVALAGLTISGAPPVVRTRHVSVPVSRGLATRWLYSKATRYIVTTGEYLRQKLIRENGIRETRIISVPTGIAVDQFPPDDKAKVRKRLNLDPTLKYVGIVATLRSWKGHLYLLDAFSELAPEDESLRLVIVGEGPMREPIERKIADLELAGKVIMAGQQQDVSPWLQAMDVFCLPSYANEGVPQALVQAMLTGLPVVTTPVGGITEAISDEVNGVLVAPQDAAAIALAVRRFLDSPSEAARMGAAARETAMSRFTYEKMLERMEFVFGGVLEKEKTRRRGLAAHWKRLQRSMGRRLREKRLPRSYERLGTRYGGWWVDAKAIREKPLLIDCGLGFDISFPNAFLQRFGGQVFGIEPNPQSLAYCLDRCPEGMQVWNKAFWTQPDQELTFFLPRDEEKLPMGADGVSGSLNESHEYAGGGSLTVQTTSFENVLSASGQDECDVLKLDIEGAEYDVLRELCRSGVVRRIRQLLVEFHHGVTTHTLADTQECVSLMEEGGFTLIHTEGRNYVFRRNDLG